MGQRAALSLILMFLSQAVWADYIFSAPPREDPAAAQKLYAPLVEELGQILGETVVFKGAQNWASYSREMQNGAYDIVLDGPHFVAWRMAHKSHVPLVRLEGSLEYTVFTDQKGPAV